MVNVSSDALRAGEFYVPGLSSEFVAKKYGVPIEDIAKLASAENPHGASPKAKAAIEKTQGNLDIYPSWTAEHLREAIGERYGFKPDNIVCGSGETEVISMVVRAFAAPEQPILMHDPCFPIYRIYTACEGRNAVFAPTGDDFDPLVDEYIKLVTQGPRIAFVTNPNNPSGRFLTDEELRKIFDAAPKDTLLVLDEAYIHYTETDGSMHLLKDYDNLIILRTFSKAFGLAGLRIGFAISANPELITPLLRIKPTWNMGQLQIIGGAAGVFDTEHVDRAVKTVSEMRKYVTAEMGKMNRFRMVPGSRANFFLAEILDENLTSTIVFNELLKRGVIVKDGTDIGVGDRYLRVDLNLKRHMDRFLSALREIETQI